MTAAEIAERGGGRQYGPGFRLPGVCHGSKKLSVSIRDGRLDCTITRCFAGCPPAKIMAALGLGMSDLFNRHDERERRPSARRAPTPQEIQVALIVEEARYRDDHEISVGERLVAADLNAVRHAVAVRLGISLAPVERRAADSHTGGHERDPLWPFLLERGWRNAYIAAYGIEPCCGVDDFALHGIVGVDLLQAAENAAAADLRSLALCAA